MSQESWPPIFDALHDMVVVAHRDTLQVVYANRATLHETGHSQETLCAHTFPDLFAAQHRATLRTLVPQMSPNQAESRAWFTAALLMQDGRPLPVEIRISSATLDDEPHLVCVMREAHNWWPVQQELARLDELNQKIISEAPIGIFTFDHNGLVTQVNQAQLDINRVSGARPQDFLGMQIIDNPTIHKNNLDEPLRRVLEGVPFQREIEEFVTRYDEIISIRVQGTPLFDGAGQVVGGLVLVEDITERKQTEKQLRDSEGRFRSLVQGMPDLLFRFDREGRFIDYEPGENIALFSEPEQFLGQPAPTDALPFIRRVFETDEPQIHEYSHMLDDGEHFYEARLMRSGPDEVLAVVRDVTEHVHANVQILKNEQMMRLLLNASSDDSAILIDTNWTIMTINDVAARRFGNEPADMVGTRLLDYYPSEVYGERFAQGERILRRGESVRFEDRRAGMDFDSRGYPILDANGKVIGAALFARDITDRKQAEAALQRKEDLLQGVARATSRLLVPGKLDESIREALAILSEYAQVDRIYVFENHPHPESGDPAATFRFEWVKDGLVPYLDDPELNPFAWEAFGLGRWHALLSRGETLCSLVRNLPPDEQPILTSRGSKSIVITPIFVDDLFWGFIGFDDPQAERIWPDDEISALRLLAASIGAAIKRQQNEDNLRRERNIAETLRDVGNVLTSTLDLDDVLARLLEQVQRVVPYEAANIMLVSDGMARIVYHRRYDTVGQDPAEVGRISYRIQDTPNLRTMAESRAPLVVADVQNHPGWLHSPQTAWIRSWLGAPIVVKGEVVALFSLDSAQVNFYSDEHKVLLAPFVQQARIAFENAQLYRQIQEQADQLKASLEQRNLLYEAAQDILSTLELNDVLARLAEHMATIARASRVYICQYDAVDICSTVMAAYPADTALPACNGRAGAGELGKLRETRDIIQTRRGIIITRAEVPSDLFDNTCLRDAHTVMLVPLYSQDRLMGIAVICDTRPDRVHTDADITLCQTLAAQAAIAIEQATLFANIQELERIKSEMIRIASHDLGGPLTRLHTLIALMEEQLAGLVDSHQLHYFEMMWKAQAQMQQIVTDILSLERIEAHQQAMEPVVWPALIRHVVDGVQTDLETSQHTLTVECQDALPAVKGNPLQMQQALANLVQNAIKYTPPQGAIVVRAFASDYGDKPGIRVEVVDNGPGIPSDQQSYVFEPFFRTPQAIDRAIPGTGLGLSLVKSAITYHGGNVYVHSAEGEGATFGFWVPV